MALKYVLLVHRIYRSVGESILGFLILILKKSPNSIISPISLHINHVENDNRDGSLEAHLKSSKTSRGSYVFRPTVGCRSIHFFKIDCRVAVFK
jgi:hypothetical protein